MCESRDLKTFLKHFEIFWTFFKRTGVFINGKLNKANLENKKKRRRKEK